MTDIVKRFDIYGLDDCITSSVVDLLSEFQYPRYYQKFYYVYKGSNILEILSDSELLESYIVFIRDTNLFILDKRSDTFIQVIDTTSLNTSSLTLKIHSYTKDYINDFKNLIENIIGDILINADMFSVNWYYIEGGGLRSDQVQEVVTDTLLDESYPELPNGVDTFINSYLDSDESILLLHGAPGTGKTRLIRKILATISKRNNKISHSIYTGDPRCYETENIFIDFLTTHVNAFIIEDADYLLDKRTDGNQIMHNFLKTTDGLLSAQGRKMIFSSNLPGTKSIDEALLRPGRCYASIDMRPLTSVEAGLLAIKLDPTFDIETLKNSKYTLAEIYKMVYNRSVKS